MTTDSSNEKSKSRLAKHLQLLGLEDAGLHDEELKAERVGIGSMKPPPLNLDLSEEYQTEESDVRKQVRAKSPVRASWYGVGVLVAAAILAVVVYVPRETETGFRIKGAAQVTVYAEKDGQVSTWDKKTPLPEGTKVRVEYKALEDAVAFVGVVDRQKNDLIGFQSVWVSRKQLEPGAVTMSSGSLEIVGENEGEILVSVVCPRVAAPENADEFAAIWALFRTQPSVGSSEYADCAVEILPLR